MNTRYTLLIFSAIPVFAWAAQPDTGTADNEFTLGQISVQADAINNSSADETVIKASDMDKFNSNTIAKALNTQPGVNIDMIGMRNETGLQVRGYDSRQVPIFLDGIPQYVPYDGYVDFARFLTADLSEIHLAKSGASLLYGANTLGGAINLISRKPQKIFEGNVYTGINSSGDKNASVNLGSNNGTFYIQGSFAYLDSDKFRLPKGFKDQKTKPTDTGNYRENAQYRDKKYSLKLGFTPNDDDEYAVGYSAIRGEKEQPVYTGDNPKIRAKYWRWPKWDKDSFYFLGNTQLSTNNRLKVRLYHDVYKNSMQMYTNDDYNIKNGDLSVYKDTTYGGSINLANTSLSHQLWQFTYQYKRDKHDDESVGEEYQDATYLFAAENKITFSDAWSMRLGLGYEKQETKHLPAKFKKGSTSSTNGLAELDYHLNEKNSLYGIASVKSRVPTLKDRYSYGMGSAIPNPDLKSERANNFELGWKGQPLSGMDANVALFYSRLRNEIQSDYVVDTGHQCRKGSVSGYCSQKQNIGRTRHMGVELSLKQQLGNQWQVGINYTYLNRKDLNDKNNPLLDTPQHKLFGFVQYNPVEKLSLLAVVNSEKGRKVSYGNKWRTLGGFATVDTKAMWQANKRWMIEAGVSNIGDKNYELSDGYPMPGRTWFTNIHYTF